MFNLITFFSEYEKFYNIKKSHKIQHKNSPYMVALLASIIHAYTQTPEPFVNVLSNMKRMFLLKYGYIRVYIYENIIELGLHIDPLKLYYLEFANIHPEPMFPDIHVQINSVCFANTKNLDLIAYFNTLFNHTHQCAICLYFVPENKLYTNTSICSKCVLEL